MSIDRHGDRRTFLAAAATAGVAIAGCLGDGSGDDQPDDEPIADESTDDDDGGDSSDEDLANYGIDHPIATGLEHEPTLGPTLDEVDLGFVLVSDPSCNYCRDFDEEIFDPMKADLIDTDELSYVYRPYPKVREWATRAAYAMLEVWERDESAWLPLKEFYYQNYADMAGEPKEMTATFLNEETDVDGDDVIEAIKKFEQTDSLAATAEAVQAAEMTVVPNYAIVVDGEVTTTTSGVQSYENIERMLGVH